jgi:hypothetical protein
LLKVVFIIINRNGVVAKTDKRNIVLDINISADRYVALYEGKIKDVLAISHDGLSVRFPGNILHKFLTHDGVSGTFVIKYGANNKFLGIEKLY